MEYLLDKELLTAKVRCNMDFVKLFIPFLADTDDNWKDLEDDHIKTTNPAIKSLLDHLNSYFVYDNKLNIDLKEVKLTRKLHEID